MIPVVLALSLLLGCSGDASKDAANAVAQSAKAPPPSPKKQLEDARKLALAGKHDEALALAEKVLAAKPEEDGVWRLLAQEAVAANQARGLLERLDAARAVGGRDGPHFLLRAELALIAGLPEDALKAARLAAKADPDGAAALATQAALAGAAVDLPAVEAGPLDRESALVGFARALDARTAEPYAKAARKVGGWRAAILRAQTEAVWGDAAAALAEYTTAAADPDPRAVIRANLGRARLAARHPGIADAGQIGGWAGDAAAAAQSEADIADAAEALDLAVDALVRTERAGAAVTRAKAIRDALGEGTDPRVSGRVGLALARADLAAGALTDAADVAGKARKVLSDAGLAPETSEAVWIVGLAAHALGRAVEVSAAADAADGARQQALHALAALDAGDMAGALAALPAGGLSDADAARVYLEVAARGAPGAELWLDRALAAADRAGDLGLRIGARLARESALRAAGDKKGAAAVRAQLQGLVASGAGGAPMRAEVEVRALLAGTGTAVTAEAGLPPVIAAWAALGAKTAGPPVGDDPMAGPISAWASGRAAGAAGTMDGVFPAFNEALGALPLHRHGTFSLGTVLDGSDGLTLDADEAWLAAATPLPVDAALAVHEVSYRRAHALTEAAAGEDPITSLPPTDGEALRLVIARARVGVAAWLAGQGIWPLDALKALKEAEGKLAKGSPLSERMPEAIPAMATLMEKLGSAAIISYRESDGHLVGIAVSKRGAELRDLGATARITATSGQLRDAMVAAARIHGTTLPVVGDRLRGTLLDPFASVLNGVGRYLILAPDSLLQFPFTVFPEQSSGLRWLADIRAVGTLPMLSALSSHKHTVDTYHPDFLGFGGSKSAAVEAPANPDAASGLVADELSACSHVFSGGLSESLVGDKATLAAWKEKAQTARYLHISAVNASPDGGFQLADGALTLSQIRATPLGVELAVITAPAPISIQLLRANALLDAGAPQVLVSVWDIADTPRSRFLGGFYESIARDRPPARALTEAREQLLHDALAGEHVEDPSVWGAFLLVGQP